MAITEPVLPLVREHLVHSQREIGACLVRLLALHAAKLPKWWQAVVVLLLRLNPLWFRLRSKVSRIGRRQSWCRRPRRFHLGVLLWYFNPFIACRPISSQRSLIIRFGWERLCQPTAFESPSEIRIFAGWQGGPRLRVLLECMELNVTGVGSKLLATAGRDFSDHFAVAIQLDRLT